jgi:hypothetical protein
MTKVSGTSENHEIKPEVFCHGDGCSGNPVKSGFVQMGWLVSPAKDGSYLCKWSLSNRSCLPEDDARDDKV